jgi:hypothetical protein
LAAVIAHFGIPDDDGGHDIGFVRVFCQWIRFDDCGVEVVNESGALGENFPETAAWSQTASTLLYVSNTTEQAILSRNNSSTTYFLFHYDFECSHKGQYESLNLKTMKKERDIQILDWPRVSMAMAACPLQVWMDDPKQSSALDDWSTDFPGGQTGDAQAAHAAVKLERERLLKELGRLAFIVCGRSGRDQVQKLNLHQCHSFEGTALSMPGSNRRGLTAALIRVLLLLANR